MESELDHLKSQVEDLETELEDAYKQIAELEAERDARP